MPRLPASLRQKVIQAAAGRCAYCRSHEHLMGVEFEVDHIYPRRSGGGNQLENLCLSCPTCNRHKAGRVYARDPETSRQTRLFHPKHDRWSEHFTWSNSGGQIIGLTPTGRATAEALLFNRTVMVALRLYWRATGVKLED